MKFVSILVLVCLFACASAQFGVKGGASDASGARSGSYFQRISPAQGTKGRLTSSPGLYSSSLLVADDADSNERLTGQRGFYVPMTRTVQPSNRFLYDNLRPAQFIQYDSGAMSTYPSYSRNYFTQPQVSSVQRVPTFASTGYGSGSYGQNTFGRQYLTPSLVSRSSQLSAPVASYPSSVPSVSADYVLPSVSSFPQSTPATVSPISGNVFTDNKISSPGLSTIQAQDRPGYAFTSMPASVRSYSSVPSTGYTISSMPATGYSVASVPSVSTGYTAPSISAPRLSTLSVQTQTSADVPVGQIFTDNKISSPGSSVLQVQERPGYTFTSVPAVRQVSSVPATGYSVASVPSVSTGYTAPSISSARLPTLSIQTPTSADLPVGQIFTDNKISSPGSSTIQTQFPIITQEKQSADIVQTTEW